MWDLVCEIPTERSRNKYISQKVEAWLKDIFQIFGKHSVFRKNDKCLDAFIINHIETNLTADNNMWRYISCST